MCNGSVQEIEFSWKWGGGTTTQFVREVVLTIRGAKFRLHSASADPSNNGTAAQQQQLMMTTRLAICNSMCSKWFVPCVMIVAFSS